MKVNLTPNIQALEFLLYDSLIGINIENSLIFYLTNSSQTIKVQQN
jgi:hypothetical protein